jgi:hypothetical protein
MTEDRRRPPATVPHAESAAGWLVLGDDDLLFEIERLPAAHGEDDALLSVVRSPRHFFIRQEAAKKVRDRDRLKAHATDRHIGQILVRALTRADDIAYLERLIAESRHLEVRKAAEAQLERLKTEVRPPAAGRP